MTDSAQLTEPADGRAPAVVSATADLRRAVGRPDELEPRVRVERAVRWAGDALDAGLPAHVLCDAAASLGSSAEPLILAADACTAAFGSELDLLARDPSAARAGTLRLIASVAATPVRHSSEGSPHGVDPLTGDPFHEFLDAALAADPDRAETTWCAAAGADRTLATQLLLSAGAAGFHLDEDRLVLAAVAASWAEQPDGRNRDAVAAARTTARRLAESPQDPDHATMRRADASVLAADAIERSPQTLGRLPRAGHERLSILASGIALTPGDTLGHLLLASLEDGLAPEDLADAILLLRAAALAITDLGDDDRGARACAGADAVRRSIGAAHSPELRYELALCAPEGPAAAVLEPVAELWVPPFDDGALGDLVVALEEADADAAAEAATAVPPDDPDSVAAAWHAVTAAATATRASSLDALVHVVAMARGFRATDHPARIWLLAAAARVAAGTGTDEEAVDTLPAEFLSPPS